MKSCSLEETGKPVAEQTESVENLIAKVDMKTILNAVDKVEILTLQDKR